MAVSLSLPPVTNATCAGLQRCAFCHSFGKTSDCADQPHCEDLYYVHRSSMLDPRGADEWLNCTARETSGEFCRFSFTVDPPRALLYIDINSHSCTGNPAVVAALVASGLLLMWLVLALGLGLPRRLLGELRRRAQGGSVRSAGSGRGSSRRTLRRDLSVRSN